MGKKRGRPTKYDPAICQQVENYSWLGATNEQMAEMLNVNQSTFKLWMVEHEEFSAAVKKGREDADSMVVKSLYRRAIGYQVKEITEDHTKIKSVDEQAVVDEEGELGTEVEYKPTVRVTVKDIAPDPTSMIFWLKNRRPKDWRDKKDIDANIQGNIVFKFDQDDTNDPLPE